MVIVNVLCVFGDSVFRLMVVVLKWWNRFLVGVIFFSGVGVGVVLSCSRLCSVEIGWLCMVL